MSHEDKSTIITRNTNNVVSGIFQNTLVIGMKFEDNDFVGE
jgi:hypothetical protein